MATENFQTSNGNFSTYLTNDQYAELLRDAASDEPILTRNFEHLNEWPDEFESFSGRIFVVRASQKKTRVRRCDSKKRVAWKSPRGWKMLNNAVSSEVMVQYRARSDEQYRYRLFCFRDPYTQMRNEAVVLFHVTFTPQHVPKNGPRPVLNVAYNSYASPAPYVAVDPEPNVTAAGQFDQFAGQVAPLYDPNDNDEGLDDTLNVMDVEGWEDASCEPHENDFSSTWATPAPAPFNLSVNTNFTWQQQQQFAWANNTSCAMEAMMMDPMRADVFMPQMTPQWSPLVTGSGATFDMEM